MPNLFRIFLLPDDDVKDMEGLKGAKTAAIWVTTDSIPTNDNNNPSVSDVF